MITRTMEELNILEVKAPIREGFEKEAGIHGILRMPFAGTNRETANKALTADSETLLFETETPNVGEWYSNCYLDRYDYESVSGQNGLFQINLSATADMREVCKSIDIKYYIAYKGSRETMWLVKEEHSVHTNSLRCIAVWNYSGQEAEVAEHMEPLAVFEWEDSSGKHRVMQYKDHIVPNGEEFIGKYEHAWPKKERSVLTFNPGTPLPSPEYESGTIPVPAFDSHDPKSFITIALFRQPERWDLDDCDYVCYVGKNPVGQPYLMVPCFGRFTADKNWLITGYDSKESFCVMTRKGGGAKLLSGTANDYQENAFDFEVSENKQTATYRLTTQWKEALVEPGSMQRFYFDFEIHMKLLFENKKDPAQTASALAVITSRKVSGVEALKATKDNVFPIAVAWGCMAENTKILMADGSIRAIQHICIGDPIASGICGNMAVVTNVWRGFEENILGIMTESGERIQVTEGHPLFNGKQYVRASALRAGDAIQMAEGRMSSVKEVTQESYKGIVYNLDLESGSDDHSMVAEGFLVGDNCVQNSNW